MRAQDDERRRIAQRLHETTAQDLAALKMQLARLSRTADGLSHTERRDLAGMMSLAEQSMSDIRTLSYLLHPPFSHQNGLLAALRCNAAGFAERSGISVGLELPERLERLPRDTETHQRSPGSFREKLLMNIQRHAESETAGIPSQRDDEMLVMEIEDGGHGIPGAPLGDIMDGVGIAGVGIASMVERVEELGGHLRIQSDHRGTIVRVRLPLANGDG